ncbi:MAG: prolyl aminopeptidase [Bdellovibrionaceae bacterium]|nr:prolyl aminopeptidase [Pseudobdellovibrionaceae bacterium]MDW8191118.1 prolyl aminopeptidase [Pseudobdellovibrionaceae bacterium]
MRDFYPKIEPFRSEFLKVSAIHTLYLEQVGNPDGVPVVFLHGGPGGGISPDHRRYFDPQYYRVVLFDQRGCGRSQPFAELRDNTTWDLVADIEKIRKHLGIERWYVFGGSWGSTLALAYGVTHPDRVLGLILRGIFLCRSWEIQWFYQEGASRIFPEQWEIYWSHIPESERQDMVSAYYRRLTSSNQQEQLAAAKIWSQWEMATSTLLPNPKMVEEMDDPQRAVPFARIECHYFMNRAFFPDDGFLLREAARTLKDHWVRIIQGRYDIVCPAVSAWELHRALPRSELIIVPDAGHSAQEPGIRSALIETMDQLKNVTR